MDLMGSGGGGVTHEDVRTLKHLGWSPYWGSRWGV